MTASTAKINALDDDSLVAVGVVCRLLGVSAGTVYRMEERRQLLPRLKLGHGCWRWRLGDIRALLHACAAEIDARKE